MTESTITNIRDRNVEKNWPQADLELSRQILESDPLYYKVPEELSPELVALALSAGASRARELIRGLGLCEPLKIAQQLNVRIIFDISVRSRRAFNALSSYKHNPPTIVVYENTLQVCREKLAESSNFPDKYLVKLTNICVAHELYHHLERLDLDYVNLSFKAPVLDLKFIKIERSLSALSEIAANSFAKHLMGLPFFPSIVQGAFFGDGHYERTVFDA